jgi:hypothetical protein
VRLLRGRRWLVINRGAFPENRVPRLSKSPVLGWFFKTVERQNELLVLIRPTIYEGQAL